jgi:hypothetical protein
MTIFCQPPWPSDTSRVWKRLAESVSFGLSVQAIGRNSNSQRNTEKKFGQYCWRKKALFKINSSSKSRKAITDTTTKANLSPNAGMRAVNEPDHLFMSA